MGRAEVPLKRAVRLARGGHRTVRERRFFFAALRRERMFASLRPMGERTSIA